MSDVIGIGASVFDILMTAERFPEEDTKIQGMESKSQCGGPCAVALVAVSKLGETASYNGIVGDDMYGDTIKEKLAYYGVDTKNVLTQKGAQSFHSFVLLNLANSSRTCCWNKGSARELTEEEVDLSALKEAKVLHLDGHQLKAAVFAAKKAKEYGVKVSLDAGGVYPGIEELLPLVDILIPSEEFARKITGKSDNVEAAAELEKRYHPEVLIVTEGVKGGFIMKDGAAKRYPSFKVKAIDSNGAGDTFHGAFIAAMLKGMDVMEAATFASATSAVKCTKFGACEGIPHFDEVEAFLKERNGK